MKLIPAVLIAATLATPAAALEPLAQEKYINDRLIAARIADRTGRTKLVVIGLGVASTLTLAAFGLVGGFAAFLLLSLLVGAVFSPMMPLGESITLRQARAGRIDYGRVRLWGSITFMVITVIAGWLIGLYGADVIHALVVAAAIATFLATLTLPADAGRMAAPRKGAALALARHPAFLLFLLAAMMTWFLQYFEQSMSVFVG